MEKLGWWVALVFGCGLVYHYNHDHIVRPTPAAVTLQAAPDVSQPAYIPNQPQPDSSPSDANRSQSAAAPAPGPSESAPAAPTGDSYYTNSNGVRDL